VSPQVESLAPLCSGSPLRLVARIASSVSTTRLSTQKRRTQKDLESLSLPSLCCRLASSQRGREGFTGFIAPDFVTDSMIFLRVRRLRIQVIAHSADSELGCYGLKITGSRALKLLSVSCFQTQIASNGTMVVCRAHHIPAFRSHHSCTAGRSGRPVLLRKRPRSAFSGLGPTGRLALWRRSNADERHVWLLLPDSANMLGYPRGVNCRVWQR
jgi:hypothetical protein